jgi:hypothetical protein
MNLTPRDFVILFMSLSWASPIGLGFFLGMLGVYYWGRSHDKKYK